MLQLIGVRRPRIGYIAAAPDPARVDFEHKRAYYGRLEADLACYIDADSDDTARDLAALTACDAIHLGGGNTFEFLHWLRQREVLPVLHDYASNDRGVLIGVSAGAILMTPSVATAVLCGDRRIPEAPQDDALGLVPFHFWPHYTPDATRDPLRVREAVAARMLYGCEDGAAIVVDGSRIELLGPVSRLA